MIQGNLKKQRGRIRFKGEEIGGMKNEEVKRKGMESQLKIKKIFKGMKVFEKIRMEVMRRYKVKLKLWSKVYQMRKVKEEVERMMEKVRIKERE